MFRRPFIAALLLSTTLAALSTAQAQTPSQHPSASTAAAALDPSAPAPERPASLDSKDPSTVPVLATFIADSDRLTAANAPERFTRPRFLMHEQQIGLDVWFTVRVNNEPVILYTNPAGTAVISGRMFAINPKDPTSPDLTYLLGQHIIAATAVLAAEGKFPSPSAQAPAVADTARTAQSIPAQAAGRQAPLPGTQSPPANGQNQPAQQRPGLNGRALLTAFDAANWIESGNPTAPLIYAVVDPECPYCSGLTRAIRPAIEAGKIKVRWIVAAPLASGNGGKSMTAATAILAAANKSAAWLDHSDNVSLPPASPEALTIARSQVAANDQMRIQHLDAVGFSGVPFMLYRTKAGSLGYRLGFKSEDLDAIVDAAGPMTVN